MHSDSTPVRTCRICGSTSDQVKIRPGRRRCTPCEWKTPGAGAKGKTLVCEICSTPFYRPLGRIATRGARFCSKPCMGIAKRLNPEDKAGEIRSCATCGDPFFVWNVYLARPERKNLYCSYKCRPVHTGLPGASERARKMGQSNVGKFCGPLSVRYRGGRGRKPDYGSNWYSQSKAARERDGHLCQECGEGPTGEQHDVHHLIPLRKFDGDFETANALSNLITLCHPCHMKVEQELTALYAPWD